ncbi:peptidylprolyl isomerase [Nitrososphaera viennensis]|uniref:dolichyl-phosphooligosaccharide-protein glycotransferase n=2 Tax=Nitrososphaera viennensis TaxID=1034015 RepID=A0A060HUN4_9ARCH|nr:peptidylprolyl isomerase [Nitrososphaera viennensis]AIC16797.1 oligosaccharyl transferase STT3 [Nitrososphaera viennensis EN76]UVS68702.1 peptidylprolyl isomerase [Nitrososphaera viennensis]
MLQGGKSLFRVGSFEFQAKHLLIVAVLAMAFSSAVIMRSYPIKYGAYLNEFDPYFDYRATKYILDNGLDAYWKWHDTMSWYPEGRNIPATSQSGLHVTAAIMYSMFGAGGSLMDFTIMFPVVMGSLTVIIVFALVRVLAGTTAGLFASLLFALSPPIILRGNLGWFKSEPLGLFFGLLAAYLFISAIKHKEIKYAIPKAVLGGLILGLANASWGGIQYFSIPIALFFLALPFFRRDLTIPMYVAVAFTVFTLISAAAFPRPGMSFVAGLPGIAMMGSTVFLVAANFVGRISKDNERARQRNMAFLLIAFIAGGIGLIATGSYISPSFRYLNAINPFTSSQNALVESVAEHLTPTIADYFVDFSILLMFAGFGAWMAFQRRNDTAVFALIIGITGVYVSATFARLLVFASIGIIVLASIGLFEITRSILEHREAQASGPQKGKRREAAAKQPMGKAVKMAYVGVIIAMLLIPVFYPPNSNWVQAVDVPTAIGNGGTVFRTTSTDWIDATQWIAENTEKDAVIASWWDYGYWITTLGNRTTIADNATINQTRIESIAKMFSGDEQSGIKIAQDLKADYVVVYVVGQHQFDGTPGGNSTDVNVPIYTLGQGGEESKKNWIIRIAGYDTSKYIESDGFTPKPAFWTNTLLGKLVPYEPGNYVALTPNGIGNVEKTYKPGLVQLYTKNVKYPADGDPGQPFHLVYASPSFNDDSSGIVTGVLIYKVNKDYVPHPTRDPYNPTSATLADMTPGPQVAEITTSQGVIKAEFFPKAAPKTVDNFIQLANEGFYDGTAFHRLVPGFVIQGGDPNTKNATADRSTWGTGGPGTTVDAEFTDIPHNRGILSMARTADDPNSAGSQFFIVLDDNEQIRMALDGQYTAFGRVIEGMDVVDKIASKPTVGGDRDNSDQIVNPDDARVISVKIVPR